MKILLIDNYDSKKNLLKKVILQDQYQWHMGAMVERVILLKAE